MHIYLSPHNDDVCFSVGQIARLTGGELVNAFSVSQYVAARLTLPDAMDARIEAITAIRRHEDRQFAIAAGLNRHDLGLSDPRIRGIQPFDLSNLEAEVDYLSARLLPFLLDMASGDRDRQRHSLYCPMGIGGHRNHVAMMTAVRNNHDVLVQCFDIHLYEDLHYASNPDARQNGLDYAGQIYGGGFELSSLVLELDPAAADRKMDWVNIYASQHAHPPGLAEFSPASDLSAGPHETIWRVKQL